GTTTINNYSGGLFAIQGNATWDVCCSGGAVVINNQAGAIVTKTSTGTTTISNGIAFNNVGTLNANAGILSLAGGGTGGGTFNIASGATLDLSGGTHGLSGSISNSGQLSFSGATVNWGGSYSESAGTVVISSGTLNINSSMTAALLTLNGGTLGG